VKVSLRRKAIMIRLPRLTYSHY